MLDLTKLGTYHRRPDGHGNTLVDEQIAAGVTWAALNIGEDVQYDPSIWDAIRNRYATRGIPVGPWQHCRSIEDVQRLCQIGSGWNSPFVGCNVEDVVSDKLSLAEVGDSLRAWGKPVHMATLPWVQNSQGWEHVAFCVIALEMFPKEGPVYVEEWRACIDHAFAEGLKIVTLLYSTTSPRSTYPNVAHCVYTADDVVNWSDWHDTLPQPLPIPPEVIPVPPKPLSLTQFPYTGPCYGPSSPKGETRNRQTVKGLKRAMIRLRYLAQPLGSETDDYGLALEEAMRTYQREAGINGTGQYGRGTHAALRYEKLTSGPNKGSYAMDPLARKYVQQDALTRVYPHPKNAVSQIGQGLHETDGLWGNWAIDFMAPGGTKVLAVEAAKITRLSGRPPSDGWYGPGIFGYSVHYETPQGYRYFSTHYGTRTVEEGEHVDAGQVIGTVGAWPNDPARSHTHLGVTSPLGQSDAKKRILAISTSPRIVV